MPHFFGNLTRNAARIHGTSGITNVLSANELTHRELIEFVEAYYNNNGLYDVLSAAFKEEGIWKEAIKPLRNPSYSVIEFSPMTLWPGTLPDALPIETDEDTEDAEDLKAGIERIWRWSNFSQRKQFAARQFAMTGEMFLKVFTNASDDQKATKVFIQVIPSANVTDFTLDDMGHVIMARLDVPKWVDGKAKTWTEVWDEDGFRQWTHAKGFSVETDKLGEPIDQVKSDLPFVPWAYAPFTDVGDARGMSVIMPAIDLIDEVNRKATRLAQIMFRYGSPPWAVVGSGVDKDGMPIPSPQLSNSDSTVTIRDEEIFYMPGNSKIEFLIPSLDWDAYRNVIQDDMQNLRKTLPEMIYFELIEQGGTISGAALRYMMIPAEARAIEARGNGEAAIARADAMALHIASNLSLEGFPKGDIDAGAFDHHFMERDVFPLTSEERADVVKTYVDAGVPLAQALVKYGGWSTEDAQTAAPAIDTGATPEAQAAESEAAIEAAVTRITPFMETAVLAISDAATDIVIRSGAAERAVAEGEGGNGRG